MDKKLIKIADFSYSNDSVSVRFLSGEKCPEGIEYSLKWIPRFSYGVKEYDGVYYASVYFYIRAHAYSEDVPVRFDRPYRKFRFLWEISNSPSSIRTSEGYKITEILFNGKDFLSEVLEEMVKLWGQSCLSKKARQMVKESPFDGVDLTVFDNIPPEEYITSYYLNPDWQAGVKSNNEIKYPVSLHLEAWSRTSDESVCYFQTKDLFYTPNNRAGHITDENGDRVTHIYYGTRGRDILNDILKTCNAEWHEWNEQ